MSGRHSFPTCASERLLICSYPMLGASNSCFRPNPDHRAPCGLAPAFNTGWLQPRTCSVGGESRASTWAKQLLEHTGNSVKSRSCRTIGSVPALAYSPAANCHDHQTPKVPGSATGHTSWPHPKILVACLQPHIPDVPALYHMTFIRCSQFLQRRWLLKSFFFLLLFKFVSFKRNLCCLSEFNTKFENSKSFLILHRKILQKNKDAYEHLNTEFPSFTKLI